jgi:hypothetical protein
MLNWLRKLFRRPRRDITQVLENQLQWENARLLEGYRHWRHYTPPAGEWIECTRRSWGKSEIWKAGTEHEAMNINGLYWRKVWPEQVGEG